MITKFITSKIAGLNIGFSELSKLKKDNINLDLLIEAMLISKKANLNIPKQELISLLERKLNTKNIIKILLVSKKNQIDFTLEDAARGDKLGINYEKELLESKDIVNTIKELKNKIYLNT